MCKINSIFIKLSFIIFMLTKNSHFKAQNRAQIWCVIITHA